MRAKQTVLPWIAGFVEMCEIQFAGILLHLEVDGGRMVREA